MQIPLSSNDFKALGDALKKQKEITLERTLGHIHVEARTIPLPQSWEHEMGIQLRIHNYGIIWLQTFDSVGAAQQMVKSF